MKFFLIKAVKQFLILFFFCQILPYTLIAQTLNWAGSYGSSAANLPRAIVCEPGGNFYVAGSFSGPTDFDCGSGQNILNGNNDVFFSKHSPGGQLIWVKQIGSTGADEGVEMAFNQAGYILLAGNFSGTVDFDPSPSDFILTASGIQDAFLAWFDTSGNFLNAIALGGNNITSIQCMTITQNQQILIGGYFSGNCDFDPSASLNSLNAQGAGDGFLLALDPFGNFLWVDAFGGNDNFAIDEVTGVCEHSTGDLFVSGFYATSIDLDPGSGTNAKVSNGGFDFFVSRLGGNNNFISGISLGGTGNDLCLDIGSQPLGNIILSGSFENTVEFNPQGSGYSKTSGGMSDAFWLCMDENFTPVWLNQIGGIENDEAGNLWCDVLGNVFSGGFFSAQCDFDPGAGMNQKTSHGAYDFFATVFDPYGNTLGAYTIGGPLNDVFYDFAKGPGTSFYYCGSFRYTLDADAGPDSLMLYTPPLTLNSFVMNLERCLLPDLPLLSQGPFQVCEGSPVLIEILSGDLNDATDWTWYSDSCGGNAFATGLSQFIYPSQSISVFVKGEGGCVNNGPCSGVFIEVLPAPLVSLGNDTVICMNDLLMLEVDTNFSSYLWSNGDTGSSLVFNTANYSLGTQAVSVTVSNAEGCTGSDEIIIDITLCNGIEKKQKDNEGGIWIVAGENSIEINTSEGGTFQLFHAGGKLIHQWEAPKNQKDIIRLDVTTLSNGFYFITTEQGMAQKFVLQR